MARVKRDENRVPTYSKDRATADSGEVSQGTIAFAAGDNLTTEKQTSAISFPSGENYLHPDGLYVLAIEKPADATAGNLTIYVYNQITIDGTNSRDVLVSTHTVDDVSGANTYRQFLIRGLFVGDGTIKIGAKFDTDSGALTVAYQLFML